MYICSHFYFYRRRRSPLLFTFDVIIVERVQKRFPNVFSVVIPPLVPKVLFTLYKFILSYEMSDAISINYKGLFTNDSF